ncbi:carboxypeptidase regulatory-like domain-containing protein [Acidobacteriota bacterium]
MLKHITRMFTVLFLVCVLASVGFAQGRQTGSIGGTVIDNENNPLPGATVSLSGPALLGFKSYVTSEAGKFRFPALSPGKDYVVKVEMPGFKTLTRPGLIVNVGRTTDIEIEMQITTIAEEVTVTAPSPVVDMQSSKTNVNYSAQFISSIPMNRDLYDIQNSIPGAISEGRAYRRTSSILGGTVRSVLYQMDGVPMNDPATFYSMANINVDVYEEIEFGISGHQADTGQTDSTVINIVTKSGGNKFSGMLTGYYTSESLAQDMIIEEDIEALNVDKPEKFTDYKDISFNLGGPIISDKMWFFVNGRRQVWGQANPLVPETRLQKIADANPGLISAQELEHYDLEHQEWLGFGKLTFQFTNNLKYMGMFHYNHMYEPVYSNRVGSTYSLNYTAIWNHENTYTTTHQLQWVLDQNTFLDIRGTYIHRFFPINSRPGTEGNYTFYDRANAVYWGATSYNDEYVRKKILASAQATKFMDDFLGSSHEFKAGFEFEQTEYHRDWFREGGNPYYSYWRDFNANNPYYYSTSGRRGRLYIRRAPGESGQWDVQDHTRRFSGFIQDSFTKGRFAVNVGLRLDHSYQFEPEQNRPELRYKYPAPLQNPSLGTNELLEALIAQWHADPDLPAHSPFDALTTPYKRVVEFTTLSPRIGLVYDIFGTGQTALKLSFSRYYEPVWSAKYNGGQIFGAGSVNYYWYDLNKDKIMDLPGVDRYALSSIPNQDPNFSYYPKDLKAPYTNEFVAGIEHELVKDFKVGFTFMYKLNKNLVEDVDLNNGYDASATDENGLIWLPYTSTDPGWDGEFGTEDDGQITIYGLRDDRPAPRYGGANPPEAKRTYWATILTFEKRMSNNWQFQGSIMYSSFRGNTDPGYSATEGQSGMFDNPNTLTNAYGSVAFDRPFQLKLMGTYILPYDIILSAYVQARSGSAWRRTFSRVYFPSDMDVQASYVSVPAESNGTRRNAPYTNIDLRVEKSFSISDIGKINVYVDIFNVGGRSGVNINQNPNGWLRNDQNPVAYTYDTTYGLITSVYGVRSVRIGARISF